MLTETTQHDGWKSLTPYETEVVRWIAAGKRMEEIAELMGRTRVAVQQATFRVKNKVGACTCAGVVAMALRQHIID